MQAKGRPTFSITARIVDTVTAGLLLVLLVVTFAPDIGLDFIPNQWSAQINSLTPKVILGVLGFIAFNLFVEQRRVFSKMAGIEKKLNAVYENSMAVGVRLAEQIPSAQVFNSREHSYSNLRHRVAMLPPRTSILVTHFEKNRSAPYDIGEREAERAFVAEWDRLVREDMLDVKQIIHVTSTFDLDEVHSRIEEYRKCLNMDIGVMVGPFVQPYHDLIIAEGYWVAIALPSDPNNPCVEKMSIFFDSSKVADSYAKSFMANWGSTDCQVVKKGTVIDEQYLARLKSILPVVGNEGLVNKFRSIPCEMAALGRLSDPLVECIAAVHDLARRSRVSAYSQRLFEAVWSLRDTLTKEKARPFVLTGQAASTALIELVRSAERSIHAVSIELTPNSFWTTQVGRTFLAANKEVAHNGVQLQRIFVEGPEGNRGNSSIVRDHQSFADCGVVPSHQASGLAEELLDFVIVDSEVLYVITKQHDGQIDSCEISIGENLLSPKMEYFQRLWNIRTDPETFFRRRPKETAKRTDDLGKARQGG